MKSRIALFFLLCAPLTAGCFQELDPCAAGGPNCPGPPQNSTVSASTLVYADSSGACPQGFVPGGNDGVDAGSRVCIPYDDKTPAIDLGNDASTDDQCIAAGAEALAVRTKYCGMCHSAGAGLGGFKTVEDNVGILSATSTRVKDDAGAPAKLVIPGHPDDSRLYHRIVVGEMPPSNPPVPIPTVSDISILRAWIFCLGGLGPDGQGAGGSVAPPPTTTTTPDAGTSPVDAGASSTDAGTPPADGGRG